MTSQKETQCNSVCDFERFAEERLEETSWQYFEAGHEDGTTVRDNKAVYKRYRILPRFLVDVSKITLSTSILGHSIPFPMCIAPTGLHKLAHPDGEVATARAAVAMETAYSLACFTTCSVRDVLDAAPRGLRFMQTFLFPKESLHRLVKIADTNDFKAIIVTIDPSLVKLGSSKEGTGQYFKPKNIRFPVLEDIAVNGSEIRILQLQSLRNASATWDDLRWLIQTTNLPVIVKGVLTAAAAEAAVQAGAKGILVSNHGGRVLDYLPNAIDCLPSVARAVAGRCEVYVDGGIRTGFDVFKALALGARAVFIGRPVIYGLAHSGEQGVQRVLEILRDELTEVMAFSGCPRVADITPDLVVHESQIHAKI